MWQKASRTCGTDCSTHARAYIRLLNDKSMSDRHSWSWKHWGSQCAIPESWCSTVQAADALVPRNPKVHRVHTIPHQDTVPSPTTSQIPFFIILISTPRYFPSRLSNQNVTCRVPHVRWLSHCPWFDIPNNTRWTMQIVIPQASQCVTFSTISTTRLLPLVWSYGVISNTSNPGTCCLDFIHRPGFVTTTFQGMVLPSSSGETYSVGSGRTS
jgi:hypothetical protein